MRAFPAIDFHARLTDSSFNVGVGKSRVMSVSRSCVGRVRDDEKDTGNSAVSNACVQVAGEGGQLYSLPVPLRGSFRVLRSSCELCTSGGSYRASEVGSRTCRTPALEQRGGGHEHWWCSAPTGPRPHSQELLCDICADGGHMPRERGLHNWLGHPMVGAREGDLVLPL